jgi:hypothetical protein
LGETAGQKMRVSTVGAAVRLPAQRRKGAGAAETPLGYGCADLAERAGVTPDTVRSWVAIGAVPCPGDTDWRYNAADVVWCEALGRLVRSGVPVARAAVLLRSARNRTSEPLRPGADLPKPPRRGSD